MKNKLMTREMAEVFANELDVTVRTLVRNYGVVIVPSVNDMQISSSFKVPVCEARGYNTKAERESYLA
ncbi:MAG: hypothetical protein IT422_26870 [Pirellulaceae bacterium]|nr:hypothetical protein [Pirellulaceae bacterium]